MNTNTSPSQTRSTFPFLAGLMIGLSIWAVIGAAYGLGMLWQRLPAIEHLADYDPKLPMRIYARDGSLLAEYGQPSRPMPTLS